MSFLSAKICKTSGRGQAQQSESAGRTQPKRKPSSRPGARTPPHPDAGNYKKSYAESNAANNQHVTHAIPNVNNSWGVKLTSCFAVLSFAPACTVW